MSGVRERGKADFIVGGAGQAARDEQTLHLLSTLTDDIRVHAEMFLSEDSDAGLAGECERSGGAFEEESD